MLRGIVTLASRDAALLRPFAASPAIRGFSSKIKEKGSADENIYFNQEDGKAPMAVYSFIERALQSLLKKVQAKKERDDQEICEKEEALRLLFKQHELRSTEALIIDIMELMKK